MKQRLSSGNSKRANPRPEQVQSECIYLDT